VIFRAECEFGFAPEETSSSNLRLIFAAIAVILPDIEITNYSIFLLLLARTFKQLSNLKIFNPAPPLALSFLFTCWP
jgi:hypothetical protein